MTEKKISRKELERKHQVLKLTLKSKNELNDELRKTITRLNIRIRELEAKLK